MLEGKSMSSNMAAKTTFCLHLVKRLIVTLRCAVNVSTSSFQRFLEVQKSHLGHVTSYELTHFKKIGRVWKTKSLSFCLRYDPLIVFWRQNHITFIFITMISHDLLVQMAYFPLFIGVCSGCRALAAPVGLLRRHSMGKFMRRDYKVELF